MTVCNYLGGFVSIVECWVSVPRSVTEVYRNRAATGTAADAGCVVIVSSETSVISSRERDVILSGANR